MQNLSNSLLCRYQLTAGFVVNKMNLVKQKDVVLRMRNSNFQFAHRANMMHLTWKEILR